MFQTKKNIELIKREAEIKRLNSLLSEQKEHFSEELKMKDGKIADLSATVNGCYLENQRLLKIVEDDRKFKEDIEEYLQNVADILIENQKQIIEKKKATKIDMMSNISRETRAKLK